jgi:Dynein light intermediate chain (DLIC)
MNPSDSSGGDISEPKLLEVPLTVQNLPTTAVVICCDLSKPQNCLGSLLKWVKLVKNVVDHRLRDLQSTDAGAAGALREAATLRIKDHDKDAKRLSPIEISLYIVANKYDIFKAQSSADRRCLMQVSALLCLCVCLSMCVCTVFTLK